MHKSTSASRGGVFRCAFSIYASVGLLTAVTAAIPATSLQVSESVAGPVAADARYVVSPRGAHLAVVARKGSRWNVIVDGVAGPRIDDVITPTFCWIDPRPIREEAQRLQKQVADLRPVEPVVFSQDGTHFAYVAKMSDQWALFADGKEVVRIPAPVSPSGMQLDYAGADGTHLLLVVPSISGNELWVDGQKWPGYVSSGGGGSAGTVDPIVSADGHSIAYLAVLDRKDVLVVNGKVAGYFGDNLQMTADGAHLLSLSRTPQGQAVLVDGKPLVKAREILQYWVSPAGHHVAAVLTHFNQQTNMREGCFLLVDGKPVEASLGEEIKEVVFSPDGKRYAAICGKSGVRFLVVDGKKGQEYQDILSDVNSIRFSPDSSRVAYYANAAGKTFVVVDEEESEGLTGMPQAVFSPDSRHVAITGTLNNENVLMLDGRIVAKVPANRSLYPIVFSPDSTRYAAGGGRVVDGKMSDITPGSVKFSPDSKHVAIMNQTLVLDGQPLATTMWNGIGRAFSPDSQHLCWITREPATAPEAPPNSYEEVIYIDGRPALHLDDFIGGAPSVRNFYAPPGLQDPWRFPREWSFEKDGTFICLAPAGGVVKRYTITLPSDTNLSSLITETKPHARTANAGSAPRPRGAVAASSARAAGTAPGSAMTVDPIASVLAGNESPAGAAKAMQANAADAAIAKAKAEADKAAAKTKSWLDSLTKRTR